MSLTRGRPSTPVSTSRNCARRASVRGKPIIVAGSGTTCGPTIGRRFVAALLELCTAPGELWWGLRRAVSRKTWCRTIFYRETWHSLG